MDKKITIVLGTFDGVHLGHQELIKKACEVADKANVFVCAFDPHPMEVLSEKFAPKRLTSSQEKKFIIENIYKVNYYEMEFTKKIANMDMYEYLAYLKNLFDIENIVVGYNYMFGKGAKYSAFDLKKIAKVSNINVYIVEEQVLEDISMSSTRVRLELALGNIDIANLLLGRKYHINGIVTKGKGLGQQIGFATANVDIVDDKIQFPAIGVYCTRSWIKGKWYLSMTNIGINPTINKSNLTKMETHIIDFSDELYGENILVEFHKKIRDEKKFSSIDDLIAQLKLDRKKVIEYFATTLDK